MERRLIHILFPLIATFGCKYSFDDTQENIEVIEIVSLILRDSTHDFQDAGCVMSYPFMTLPDDNKLRSTLKVHLQIRNEDHLEDQIEKVRELRIDSELAGQGRLIDHTEIKEGVESQSGFRNWIRQVCPKGYVALSRPLFNENFRKAFILVDGPVQSEERLYTKVSGTWKLEKVIYRSPPQQN